MTTDEQYVPSEDLVIEAWKRYSGAQDAKYARLSDGDAGDEARRFLARVRRDAKAEALREMQEHHEREADKAQTITARGIHLTIADGARNRATEYETGDRA